MWRILAMLRILAHGSWRKDLSQKVVQFSRVFPIQPGYTGFLLVQWFSCCCCSFQPISVHTLLQHVAAHISLSLSVLQSPNVYVCGDPEMPVRLRLCLSDPTRFKVLHNSLQNAKVQVDDVSKHVYTFCLVSSSFLHCAHWVLIRLWDALGTRRLLQIVLTCVAVGCHVPRADARVDVASNVPLHFLLLQMSVHPLEIFGIVDGSWLPHQLDHGNYHVRSFSIFFALKLMTWP